MQRRAWDLVRQAARAFDAELHTQAYSATHADWVQLNRLLSYLPPLTERAVLDLATGAGYVALEVARQNPGASVIGLDIAPGAIARNVKLSEQQGLSNLRFLVFNGATLPFTTGCFSAVFCRYALHHFPLPRLALTEIVRTLHNAGKVIVADAIKARDDTSDFINKFQRLKKDGHVRMYAKAELLQMFRGRGLRLEDSFESSLTFNRAYTGEYGRLIAATPTPILKAYHLSVTDDLIQLTLPIFNGVFVKHRGR